MLLNIERMTRAEWSHEIVKLIQLYQQQQNTDIMYTDDESPSTRPQFNKMSQPERRGRWEAKQNDQDVFNAVMTLRPQWFRVLPCAWNVQFHARLNSVTKCIHTLFPTANSSINGDPLGISPSTNSKIQMQPDEIRHYLWLTNVTFSDVPLNCDPSLFADGSSSIADELFVCEVQPKVLHFMAGAYNGYYHFLRYFAHSWEYYFDLSWQKLCNKKYK